MGINCHRYGFIGDDPEVLLKNIEKAIKENDILLLSGGVSVGDYDLVMDTLEKCGAQLVFWKVNQMPGKPLAFYRYKDRFIFGLPGNPVSVMVCFEFYVRPLIRKYMGFKELFRPQVTAESLFDYKNESSGRTNFARIILKKRDGGYFFETTGSQGSGILTSMAKANGLAVFPADKKEIRRGERLKVYLLKDQV